MLPLPPPPSFNVRASAQWWFDGLFQSSSQDFFALFNKYLEVRITTRSRSGGDKAIQAQHRNWFGFVESKIRCLVVDMEAAAAREGLFLHPQANCYHRRSDASLSALCLSSSILGTGADGAEVEAKVLATSPSLSH
jgi:poly(A) polymerase Pap1